MLNLHLKNEFILSSACNWRHWSMLSLCVYYDLYGYQVFGGNCQFSKSHRGHESSERFSKCNKHKSSPVGGGRMRGKLSTLKNPTSAADIRLNTTKRMQCDQIWQQFCILGYFYSLRRILRLYLVFYQNNEPTMAKTHRAWQLLQIAKYWANNLAIWSHWTTINQIIVGRYLYWPKIGVIATPEL